jgi:hypothetical protein
VKQFNVGKWVEKKCTLLTMWGMVYTAYKPQTIIFSFPIVGREQTTCMHVVGMYM